MRSWNCCASRTRPRERPRPEGRRSEDPAMRSLLTAAVVLGVCLVPPPVVRAGVYNTAEPLPFPVLWDFNQFQKGLGDLLRIASNQPGLANPRRDAYLKEVAALEEKERSVGLSVEDRVN